MGESRRRLRDLGRREEAEPWAKNAAETAKNLPDPHTRCIAFYSYAHLLGGLGRSEEAEPWAKNAAETAKSLPDLHTRCIAFDSYSHLLRALGRSEEAEPWAKRAVTLATELPDPHTRCNAWESLGLVRMDLGKWPLALGAFREAAQALLQSLEGNRWPRGVSEFLRYYSQVFDRGLLASEKVLQRHDDKGLWTALEFADGLKAIAIREGLRRHASQPLKTGRQTSWQPGPAAWEDLFHPNSATEGPPRPAPKKVEAKRVAVRGARTAGQARPASPTILELPEDLSPRKGAFARLAKRRDLAKLLPDRHTVLIVCHFLDDRLFLLPVRKQPGGEPEVIHDEKGFLSLPEAREPLAQLARDLRRLLNVMVEPHRCGIPELEELEPDYYIRLSAKDLRRELAVLAGKGDPASAERPPQLVPLDMDDIVQRLGEVLRLDQLLDRIEPDRSKWAKLHLVLLPDGPLYQLPLHAAPVPGLPKLPLIDAVASVRYSLSLRTLLIQHGIEKKHGEEKDDPRMRGVMFVSPDGVDYPRLSLAPEEVARVIVESPKDSWRIFGERGGNEWLATRKNMRSYHPTPNLLWAAAHGGMLRDRIKLRDGTRKSVVAPSLWLHGRPLSTARLVAEGYDLRRVELWHNNCCLLGRLEEREESRQVEGYVAALTLVGLRRVSSALWELGDHAATEFARHYIPALLRNVFRPGMRSPHAFAIALKEALASFRRADKRRFDHEFFWAPYTLYGLG